VVLYRCGVALLLSFFIPLLLPALTHAQQYNVPTSKPLELAVSPAFPRPESRVTVRVNAYAMDTNGARITWSVNGEKLTEGKDSRSLELMTGALGTKMTVSAFIEPIGESAFTLTKTIIPATVDVVVEADTYVPAFYRGRALPSVESTVRLTAIPHVGNGVDPRTLTYRWEQNGSAIGGGGVRGLQSIELAVPRYSGGNVRVVISNASGVAVADATVALEAMNPEIHFYEENPLRGLSELAIRDSVSLIGDETTVHGEPYYLSETDVRSDNMSFTWSIDGTPVTTGVNDPHIITLRRTGGAGVAGVGLLVKTRGRIPQFIQDQFVINF
jgi:hypothetical protein